MTHTHPPQAATPPAPPPVVSTSLPRVPEPAPGAPDPAEAPNPEAELAFRFVTETNVNVFLTGRAGTGKTTLLHRLRRSLEKSFVVVAPTGVAAINASGTTIHSQLQLPFGLLTEKRMTGPEGRRSLAKAKVDVLRRIDLLIVDEVSMVRADVMDAIDHQLRRVRQDRRPFGGVQLLLIGDLHQLPPVVRGDEERDLRALYETPYFFSASALREAGLVTVELKRVYRQTDAAFVRLLGEVRANRMTDEVLARLNTRYRDAAEADRLDGYITLTSHRRAAERINRSRLADVPASGHRYSAKVTGSFPEGSYPTDEVLELKVGAQVMFVKNDPEGAYHNGKIGTVTKLEEGLVTVDCGADGGEIATGPVRWENTKYKLDRQTKEVGAETAGTFSQVPLRLAWAITIHKSQGLTFERVVIDAAAAFAHGQVYVALSRCRSFEGIVLRSSIESRSVRTDRQVSAYSARQAALAPDETQLAAARVAYRQQLLRDAFDFAALARATEGFRRHGLVSLASYPGLTEGELDGLADAVRDRVHAVGQKFRGQLEHALHETDLAADPTPVPPRCRQAVGYFLGELGRLGRERIGRLDLETDNAEAGERGQELLAALRREHALATATLRLLDAEAFTPGALTTTRAKLSVDAASGSRPGARTATGVSGGSGGSTAKVAHPLLYTMISDWRAATAKALEVRTRQVLSVRDLRAICAALPKSAAELAAVEGIGAKKVARFGEDVLGIVARYLRSPLSKEGARALREDVSSTVSLTVSMFRTGATPAEIAAARGYATNTIYGHLADGIAAGAIDGENVLPSGDLAALTDFLRENDGDLTGLRARFGGRYGHGEAKVAKALWRRGREARHDGPTTRG